MNARSGFVDHLAAIPALLHTAPSWDSDLVLYALVLAAVGIYIRIGREITAELAGE